MAVDGTRNCNIAVIGGYYSANLGGVAMTDVVADHGQHRGCGVQVLTMYPKADAEMAPDRVQIVPWRPRDILLSLPLAFLVFLLRVFRLPARKLLLTRGLRALGNSSIVVDVAGISFADGRDLATLTYNTLMTGIPLLVGAPTIKASQALGPFRSPMNRLAARIILPRLRMIVARGDETACHLADLGLENVVQAPDLAFALEVDGESTTRAHRAIAALVGQERFVSLVPSSVVRAYCDRQGIDYVQEMGELASAIVRDLDRRVIVVPHSMHPTSREGRMHDLEVCRAVCRVAGSDEVSLLDQRLDARTLRAVIGCGEATITSRFHGMISGLATTTPTLVVGWSHKYEEVLRDFDLGQWAVDYSHIAAQDMRQRTSDLLDNADPIRAKIDRHLPSVVDAARRNLDVIDDVLGRRRAHKA